MEKVFAFLFDKRVVSPIVIILVSLLLVKIIKIIIRKVFAKDEHKDSFEAKKKATIIKLANIVVQFFIYAIAIMMILEVFGVDTKGILASLGIAGVVLGLALQSTVQDLMSGITIILDNYYVIGDTITINDFTGEVIEVGLQSTKVKSYDGKIYIFANRNVNSVINLSQMRAGIKIEIPTSYEESSTKVEKVLKEIVEEAKKIANVDADSTYLGIEKLDDSAINYAIIIYCKSKEQWDIKRIVLKMIKDTYDKEGLKIPYNQIEVHNGTKSL